MNILNLIEKKKRGKSLIKEEYKWFIDSYIEGTLKDYQATALLMAIYFQGMEDEELYDFTILMRDSGDVLSYPDLKKTVDKHSTGGVGDLTTLVIGPLAASLGMTVVKMSGRGLGHTGGTLDKLESIKGLRVELTKEEIHNFAKENGVVVGGQTGNLAPADKKFYALRDVTGTVDSIPLIASSIMSKKLASGAEKLVLDVKLGSGAFMKDLGSARKLANYMVEIGKRAGVETRALITDMDQPLGFAVGNALEVAEAVEILKGQGPDDIRELSINLVGHMGVITLGLELEEAKSMAEENLDKGRALEAFKQMVVKQGGTTDFIDNLEDFTKAKASIEVKAQKDGYVSSINAELVGRASLALGGGREELEDQLDLKAGIVLKKKRGKRVKAGDVLALIQSDTKDLEEAKTLVLKAYEIDGRAEDKDLIIDIIK